MRFIAFLFWIVVIILAVLFTVLNSHSVLLNYYLGEANIYVPFLLLMTLIVGALLGIAAMLPTVCRLKGQHRKLKQRINSAEQEVNNLRSIPIKDTH